MLGRGTGTWARGPPDSVRTLVTVHAWPWRTQDSHGYVRGKLRKLWMTCPRRLEIKPTPWMSLKDSNEIHLWKSKMAL